MRVRANSGKLFRTHHLVRGNPSISRQGVGNKQFSQSRDSKRLAVLSRHDKLLPQFRAKRVSNSSPTSPISSELSLDSYQGKEFVVCQKKNTGHIQFPISKVPSRNILFETCHNVAET